MRTERNLLSFVIRRPLLTFARAASVKCRRGLQVSVGSRVSWQLMDEDSQCALLTRPAERRRERWQLAEKAVLRRDREVTEISETLSVFTGYRGKAIG